MRLALALVGNRCVERRILQPAAAAIVEPVEQRARNAEARGHDAARVTRMHSFGEHLDAQHTVYQAAQRSGAPELVVIAAAGIEPDAEGRRADARGERFKIRRQVVAAAFLAALDEDDAAPVRPLALP